MKKMDVTCPITASMSVVGGKWKSVILWYLKDDPKRFGVLKKLIPECSLKMFNDNLKDLEKNGIVIRNVFAGVPLKVEYSLSDYGKTLLPIILSLRQWGVLHLIKNPEIMSTNDNLQNMIKLIIEHEGIA